MTVHTCLSLASLNHFVGFLNGACGVKNPN